MVNQETVGQLYSRLEELEKSYKKQLTKVSDMYLEMVQNPDKMLIANRLASDYQREKTILLDIKTEIAVLNSIISEVKSS